MQKGAAKPVVEIKNTIPSLDDIGALRRLDRLSRSQAGRNRPEDGHEQDISRCKRSQAGFNAGAETGNNDRKLAMGNKDHSCAQT